MSPKTPRVRLDWPYTKGHVNNWSFRLLTPDPVLSTLTGSGSLGFQAGVFPRAGTWRHLHAKRLPPHLVLLSPCIDWQ